jgi:hypothetical protein
VIYGPGAEDDIVDPVAIEAIEVGCARGARVAVLTDTTRSASSSPPSAFGAQLSGVVSLEEIQRRLGRDFDPPGPFMPMPDPFTESAAFKEAVRRFSDRTLKPIGSAIGPLLRNTLDRRGLPDVVFERAVATASPCPRRWSSRTSASVVYAEDLAGRRFSFYAPQVWMRQRRILMPSAEIRGTHLNTAREYAEVQERIAAGMIDVVEPVPVPLTELPRRTRPCGRTSTPAPPTSPSTACRARPEDARRALPRLGPERRRSQGIEGFAGSIPAQRGPYDDISQPIERRQRPPGRPHVILTGAAGNIGSHDFAPLLREGRAW